MTISMISLLLTKRMLNSDATLKPKLKKSKRSKNLNMKRRSEEVKLPLSFRYIYFSKKISSNLYINWKNDYPAFSNLNVYFYQKTYWWRGWPYPQLTCSFPYYTKTHTCTTPVLFLVKNLYFNKNLIKKSKKFLSLVKILVSTVE